MSFFRKYKVYIWGISGTAILIILAILLPILAVNEDNINIADIILTALLVIAAIFAGYLAWRNLHFLRKQQRHNTFLSLMNELSSESLRKNLEIINFCMEPDANGQYLAEIPINRIWSLLPLGIGQQIGAAGVTNSIEEIVSCLDKVGFFLLQGDPKLKDEAPMRIWAITNEMWEKLSAYVKHQQKNHYSYGQYFERLNKEAEKRGYIKNAEELKESKEVT